MRDRLNSPLQTLEIGLELLRRGAADATSTRLIARLQSTLERLKGLSHQLARALPGEAPRDEQTGRPEPPLSRG